MVSKSICQFASLSFHASLFEKRIDLQDHVNQTPISAVLKYCLPSDQAQAALHQLQRPADNNFL